MSQAVGYLEGTDPLVLTRLNLQNIGTFPLGNGYDGHGKYVGHITKSDRISVIVGYLHKIMPVGAQTIEPRDFLLAAHSNDIPVLIVAPADQHATASQMLGEAAEWVTLVAPEELFDKAMTLSKT